MVYKKKHYKDSVIQLYKDFRQQQQKQRAEDDKRLREELFRNLDYITQETEREKKEKECLNEDEEAEKTQLKINIKKQRQKPLLMYCGKKTKKKQKIKKR